MSSLLEFRDISKRYLTDEVEIRALNHVSFQIQAGEYVAIEGPSGCGKSTLLSILGLLDTATSGEYIVDGSSTRDLSDGELTSLRNSAIGFVFQNFNLIGDIDVFDNVALPLEYRGLAKAECRKRVEDVLMRVGVAHRARHFPSRLSGGEQQRVAVARAIVGNPLVLLADEPTGNLDSANGETVMQLLDELSASGTTIVMVTHDPRFSRRASRTLSMIDGALNTSVAEPVLS